MQYPVSVICDAPSLATSDEMADLDVALKLAAAESKTGDRRVEVRPFL